MATTKGDQFWKLCKGKRGAPRKYKTPEELWKACEAYFEWAVKNPWKIQKHVTYQGKAHPYWEERPRAMLLTEMFRHIGIDESTWRDWRKNRDDLSLIIAQVEDIIWENKFQGAAVDLFNPNIVAQQLGLKTKVEHSNDFETLEEFLGNLQQDDAPENDNETK